MKTIQKQIYGTGIKEPNTFIGNVSGSISTPALLASKLLISVSRIRAFKIIGADIECAIVGGSYTIPNGAFQFNTTPCSYYKDPKGLVTAIGDNGFYDINSFTNYDANFENCLTVGAGAFYANNSNILLKNAVTLGNSTFYGGTNIKVIYIPKVTTIGTDVGMQDGAYQRVFLLGGKPLGGLRIYAHPSMATINGGGVEGDLANAISRGAIVSYVTNFTTPNPVTNLTVASSYNTALLLNFTPPSSTNTIDYYECYADGIFKNIIRGSGDYITGLSPTTNYNITIIAVDIFYNKSLVSNVVNASTNTTTWLNSIIFAAYNLANGIDSKNGYNATVGSDVTFSPAINGNGANFINNVNSYMTVADAPIFSFTNGGGIDKPFSISFFIKFNSVSDQWIVNKRGGYAGNDEWQIAFYQSKIIFCLFDITQKYIEINKSFAPVIGQFYHIAMTYDGSKSQFGLKLYINGVLQSTTNIMPSVYGGTFNGVAPVTIGRTGWEGVFKLNGQLDELYIFSNELTQSDVTVLQTNFYPFP